MTRGFRQQHIDVHGAGATKRLSHACTRISSFNGIENVLDLETRRRERLRAERDHECGRAILSLELQIDDAFDLTEGRDHLFAGGIECVEVVAEHLDGDLGGLAAQAFADAIAEEGDNLTLYPWILPEDAA